MSTAPAVAAREQDEKGVGRLGIGAGLGFAGAIAAIVIPLFFLYIASQFPSGFFTFGVGLIQVTSVLVLVGAILLVLSLFFYRRSFSALRRVDSRFYAASVLCLIRSVGFLLVLVAAAVVVGDSSSLLACAKGSPTHALSCLESGEPFGAATALLGFFLGWLGGVGFALGLGLGGSRFRAGALTGAAIIYGILLAFVFLPFAGLFVPVPSLADLVVIVPLLALLAPGLALAGSLRAARRMSPA